MDQSVAIESLVDAIVKGDAKRVGKLLIEHPKLATASFAVGATRLSPMQYFCDAIRRNRYAGDTALHFAAAAFQIESIELLLRSGADCRAQNRLNSQPLHAACVGRPGDRNWQPEHQSKTIKILLEAGAMPNTFDGNGATPLHIAVRTRSALAVKTLLACGADPRLPNKNGSIPLLLAELNTGRSGSGSREAKLQQAEILVLLKD